MGTAMRKINGVTHLICGIVSLASRIIGHTHLARRTNTGRSSRTDQSGVHNSTHRVDTTHDTS